MSVNEREIGGAKKSNKKHVVIGKIYADWCGHCQQFAPEWKELESKIGDKVTMHKVRSGIRGDEKNEKGENIAEELREKEKTIMEELNSKLSEGKTLSARGFPSIYKIQGGNLEEYSGPRTVDELSKWATGMKTMGGAKKRKSKKAKKSKKGSRKNKKSTCKPCSMKLW